MPHTCVGTPIADREHVAAGMRSGESWTVRPGLTPGTVFVCFGDHEIAGRADSPSAHERTLRGEPCKWVEFTRTTLIVEQARNHSAHHEHTVEQGEGAARDLARIAGAYYRELIKGNIEPEQASQLTASFVMVQLSQKPSA